MEKEKKRKLSEKEKKRKEEFDLLCEQMTEKGYEKKELLVSVTKANLYVAIMTIPVFVIGCLLFYRHNGFSAFTLPDGASIFLTIIALALIVVHELIHGITWSIFCENHFRDIDFGFMKEYLTPYCVCKTPLRKGPYLLGALMPLIVLGIIPTVIAIFNGSFFLLFIGLVMILAAGGDIMIAAKLLAHKTDKELLCLDHPILAGLVVFEK